MKSINNYMAIVIILISTGCDDDLLDLYPLTSKTEGNFYKNETQLNQAVDDVYRILGIHYEAAGLPDLYGELSSDNTFIYLTAGGTAEIDDISNFRILTDNSFLYSAWRKAYNGIYIINNLLYRLEETALDININESKFNAMKGQALLIRSLIYFNLVRAFGAIPYIDKKIDYNEVYDYLRTEPSIIYEDLISDLTYAKQVLPRFWDENDVGRVTTYGAAAILAKIYLTVGNTDKAKTELEYIMNSGIFSLDANNDGIIDENDFSHIFHWNTKNCKSSVLEVQYISGVNAFNSSHLQSYAPFSYGWEPPLPYIGAIGRGAGFNTPTDNLEAEFEQNDPRKETSVIQEFFSSVTQSSVYYPFTMKFFDPNWNNPGANFEIIRYADILLMYSEVTGDPQFLNQVRNRVGLPAYGTEEYPSDKYSTLALAIEHERRVELCLEYHRFFDLVRTNRALEIMQDKGYEITNNKLLFPIPQRAIDLNKKLTQNPGY